MDIKLTIARAGGGIFGVIALITGARMVWGGASAKLGEATALIADNPGLAALDNDFRFAAAIWFLMGIALIAGAIVPHRKPDLLQMGLEAVIIGGFARWFAFTEYGVLPQFYPAIAIEIIGGGIVFALFMMWRKGQAKADA